MLRGRSIKLGTVFGIRIGIDPSWFVVLFLVVFLLAGQFGELYPGDQLASFTLAVVTALLLFGSLLVHELGHAVVATRNGITIIGIDLWLLGGLAKLGREPQSAGVEFRVAAAGPLVSLLVAAACWAGVVLMGGIPDTASAPPPLQTALLSLAWVNALLLAFNLLPGFPLDGGRILRAIAWRITGDRPRATRIASGGGRIVGFGLIGLGIWTALAWRDIVSGLWLAMIGFFLAQAARASSAQADLSDRIHGLTVADVMDAEPVAVRLGTPLERVLEEYLLRYRWPWFPVVDGEDRLAGLVTLEAVEAVPEGERSRQTVDDVMAADPEGALRTGVDESIEALIARGPGALQRLGAVMAVDAEGVLRGVVTLQQLRRALRPG